MYVVLKLIELWYGWVDMMLWLIKYDAINYIALIDQLRVKLVFVVQHVLEDDGIWQGQAAFNSFILVHVLCHRSLYKIACCTNLEGPTFFFI